MRWDAALCMHSLLLFSLANLSWAFVETRGCNRTVRNSVGWIRWTGRMGRCVVRIRAPLRDPQQVIEVKVRRLQVGFLRESRCEGAYVQFSDSPEELEEETGRYCGHVSANTTRLLLRRGPELIITMDSEVKFAAENPVIFSAQFSVLPARLAAERHRGFSQPSASECPLECTVRNDHRTCRLTSPGYPGVYPRGIRCRISLESSAGRFEIGGQPEDLFSLMNYTSRESCQTENCEDHVELNSTKDRFESHELFRSKRNMRPGDRKVSQQSSVPESEARDEPRIGRLNSGTRRRARMQAKGDMSDKDDCSECAENRNVSRVKRVSNRDEDDEFVIGQMSQESRRRNGRRMKSWGRSDDLQGVRGTGLGSKGTDGKGGHHEGRFEAIQKRHRHQKRIHKKSMSTLAAARRNLEGESQDATDLRWTRRDGAAEKARKSIGHDASLVQVRGYLRRYRFQEKLSSTPCVGDYLVLLENVNGKLLEVSKFCGEGRVPKIISRSKNVIVEFFAENDGTVMHDGFQLTLRETPDSGGRFEKSCEFVYKSTDRTRETVRSLSSWYPPNTICSYRFVGKAAERISVHMKIVRNDLEHEPHGQNRNFSLNYCPGNEIAVYNGAQANGSQLIWSYCDLSHRDINNIQVPLTSSSNELLIQYYSAAGSYDGEDFTYMISYRFIKRSQNSTTRRQVQEDLKLISLRPVNFSALNLNDSENCNCDFGERIGSFKNWFMVLVVLGIVSFLGAVLTIIALLAKCLKLRSMEKKLLQTPKR